MAALADQDDTNVSEARGGLFTQGPSVKFADLTIALVTDSPSSEAAWRHLERREWNSLNQGLDWCRAWAAAHGHELLIVTGSIGGQILVMLPFEIVAERVGKTARPPGGRFNNINTGLFAGELVAPGIDELSKFKNAIAGALSGR